MCIVCHVPQPSREDLDAEKAAAVQERSADLRDQARRMSRARIVFPALPATIRGRLTAADRPAVLAVIATQLRQCRQDALAAEIAQRGQEWAEVLDEDIANAVAVARDLVVQAAEAVAARPPSARPVGTVSGAPWRPSRAPVSLTDSLSDPGGTPRFFGGS